MIDKARFRNPSNVRYLKKLFFETTLADKSTVVYTLKDHDYTVGEVTYPSLYQLYITEEDLSEYEFAMKHLDSYEHWEMLTSCSWFKPYIERWRKELFLKIQARSLKKIIGEAKTTSKDSLAANRYLLERGWEPKNTKGRPSKDDIRSEVKRQADEASRLEDDMRRMEGLH